MKEQMMYGQKFSAADTYAKVGLETGVVAASPHKLILMLFDGALLSIRMATKHMSEGNIAAKSEAISKAITIISGGLKASLDVKKGGEIAARLDALYDYMCQRLFTANIRNQPELLEEVYQLLSELQEAWKQIGKPSTTWNQPSASEEAVPSIAA